MIRGKHGHIAADGNGWLIEETEGTHHFAAASLFR
jgi:hypothetical protein